MKLISSTIIVVMTCVVSAPASAVSNACSIGGWSIDKDPKGLLVRSGPSAKARVVGRLPPLIDDKGGLLSGRGPEFQILESENSWFRIGHVYIPRIKDGEVDFVPFNVKGWISGKVIAFQIQSRKGFAELDNKSAAVFEGQDGPGGWLYVANCKDKWAQIAYGTPKEEKRAWFRGICAMQETSCDGVHGDD